MLNPDILVIGANQGALAFAYFAAKQRFKVSVVEALQKDEVCYDWSDDMVKATFERIGIPFPTEVSTKKKYGVTLLSPARDRALKIPLPEKEVDISMRRRPLNEYLHDLAEGAGATFYYGTRASAAIIEDGKVAGVTLADGGEIRAKLVVDCGGCTSVVRGSLPDCLNVPQEVNPDDTFFVRRTYYDRAEGVELPEGNRIYLKHLGERGISWCFLSPDGNADILVGRLGGLDDDTFNRAEADVKKSNPIVGENYVKGGQPLRIPVRRPIARMVADGYALVGDSAYMTIPMIGSGMASSMTAAFILSEIIKNPQGEPFSASNLYRYQLRFMKEVGAGNAVVDLIKNWFLNGSTEDLNYLLSDKIISENMLQLTTGEMNGLPVGDILRAIFNILKKPALFKKLLRLIGSVVKASKICKKMPQNFDDAKLKKWQDKYEAIYRR